MKKIISLITVFAIIATCTLTSFAASKTYTVGSDCAKAMVVEVKTDATATTLKFENRKGVILYENMLCGHYETSTFGDYLIYVTDNSGKESPKSYSCSLKKSTSVKLSANKTYTITVCPRAKDVTFKKLDNADKLFGKALWCDTFDWETNSTYTLTGSVKSMKIKSITPAPQQ